MPLGIWLLLGFIGLLMIGLVVYLIVYIVVIGPKRRAEEAERMRRMEAMWRKELKEKGLSPADIERIVEERKQTLVMQEQAKAQWATAAGVFTNAGFNANNTHRRS